MIKGEGGDVIIYDQPGYGKKPKAKGPRTKKQLRLIRTAREEERRNGRPIIATKLGNGKLDSFGKPTGK